MPQAAHSKAVPRRVAGRQEWGRAEAAGRDGRTTGSARSRENGVAAPARNRLGFGIRPRPSRQFGEEWPRRDAEKKAFAERTAVGRWGEPKELVGTALLLASDAGSYITGSTIVVD